MNSLVARFSLRVALLAAPLCALAQLHPAPVNRTENLTLLTGPTLTSPAGKRTLTPNGWIISSGVPAVPPNSLDGVLVQSFSTEQVSNSDLRAAQAQLRAAQIRLAEAEANLAHAKLERDLALAQKKVLEEKLQRGQPAFDGKLLPTSTQLAQPKPAGAN